MSITKFLTTFLVLLLEDLIVWIFRCICSSHFGRAHKLTGCVKFRVVAFVSLTQGLTLSIPADEKVEFGDTGGLTLVFWSTAVSFKT